MLCVLPNMISELVNILFEVKVKVKNTSFENISKPRFLTSIPNTIHNLVKKTEYELYLERYIFIWSTGMEANNTISRILLINF